MIVVLPGVLGPGNLRRLGLGLTEVNSSLLGQRRGRGIHGAQRLCRDTYRYYVLCII